MPKLNCKRELLRRVLFGISREAAVVALPHSKITSRCVGLVLGIGFVWVWVLGLGFGFGFGLRGIAPQQNYEPVCRVRVSVSVRFSVRFRISGHHDSFGHVHTPCQ